MGLFIPSSGQEVPCVVRLPFTFNQPFPISLTLSDYFFALLPSYLPTAENPPSRSSRNRHYHITLFARIQCAGEYSSTGATSIYHDDFLSLAWTNSAPHTGIISWFAMDPTPVNLHTYYLVGKLSFLSRSRHSIFIPPIHIHIHIHIHFPLMCG